MQTEKSISLPGFSPLSRVWIFQAGKKLSQKESALIKSKSDDFLKTWDSHGTPVQSACLVLYDYFVVLVADETTMPGGCSVDKAFRFVGALAHEMNLPLLDRTSVAFEKNGTIFCFPFNEISKQIEDGFLTHETEVFYNGIQVLEQLESAWKLPLSDSPFASLLLQTR